MVKDILSIKHVEDRKPLFGRIVTIRRINAEDSFRPFWMRIKAGQDTNGAHRFSPNSLLQNRGLSIFLLTITIIQSPLS
ncbi:MAG: hypothetical protein A4E66_00903 [Syntrophus sp. PtaB.Bin001]|nr:MAG: hypothetical protein A4E66_00903 [Syntrophus sp. PtaB.Bin001]